MTTVNQNSVTVVYPEQKDQKKAKQISFNGNFGFNIDGKKYTAIDGKFYNDKGKEVYVLELSKQTAYQFIGMSNNENNNKDYTYTANDLKQAKDDQISSYNSGETDYTNTNIMRRARTTIGYGGGTVWDASYNKGVYETRSDNNGNVSVVSVWSIKE